MDVIQLDLFAYAAMQAVDCVKLEVIKPKILRNFLHDGKSPMPVGKAELIEANLMAIRLLKKLPQELSRANQVTPARFSGWGGLTEVFMPENKHGHELKTLLSDTEYQAAQSSILDSFYTLETIIDCMWNLVRSELNLKRGKVAELGAGTGNFIGLAPTRNAYQFTASWRPPWICLFSFHTSTKNTIWHDLSQND